MATDLKTDSQAPPELQAGDRLTREEFERRYGAMPNLKKAELIEGVVYMGSPVSTTFHGDPHLKVTTWLGVYAAYTPGLQAADNATVRLDWTNEPQPDAFLRILPECGGQTRDEDDYVAGAPEFACEIAASSASYDLHDKKAAYLRNGIKEYVVWRVKQQAIDWFVLRGGEYQELEPDDGGLLHSEVFPGLRLDRRAMLAGEMQRVLEVVTSGVRSPEHAAFCQRLQAKP